MNNGAPFDLRLLLVLEAILQEGSVSAAGRRLGISQAATSNALNRLRTAVADPLFVRGPRGMEPTPRALELSEPVCDGLAKLRAAFDRQVFSADRPQWTFRLALSDHAVMIILPRLLRILRERAPEVRLEIESKWNSRIESQLDGTTIDLALGVIPHLPARFGKTVLFEEHYVCLMREDHPLAAGPLSREAFTTAGHVAVRPSIDRAQNIEEQLLELGCPRQVVLNVNQFLALPAILRETDLIAYLLCSIADVLVVPGLKIVQVPCAARSTQVVLAWSKIRGRDAANQWMRRQVVAAARSLRPGSLQGVA